MKTSLQVVRSILALAVLLAASCKKKQAQEAPPPAAVTVSKPVAREVRDWDEYAGRLQSPETANVTARVSGFVEEVSFDEGALVKKGDVLFVLDARPFTADLENKRASVQKDEAQLKLAETQLGRSSELLKSKAIATQDFDATKAQQAAGAAQLAADKAAEDTARLHLQWARVTAPISGRVSRTYVTAGNQVSGVAGQATLLTTIVSVDPMYCYISVPGSAFLSYQKLAANAQHTSVESAKIPCFIGLENEPGFPHEGVIDFIDNAVDPATGTIQMRGVIANPKGLLTSGVFARLRLARGEPYKTLLVPDQAVASEQSERYLLVVGADNAVASKTVKTGGQFGKLRAILSGLDANDRVVVNGMQKAQPGEKVTSTEVPIPAETLSAVDAPAELSAKAPGQ